MKLNVGSIFKNVEVVTHVPKSVRQELDMPIQNPNPTDRPDQKVTKFGLVKFCKTIPVDSVNKKGETPLHIMGGAGQANQLQHFLDNGVNVDAVDNEGKTALMTTLSCQFPRAGHLAAANALVNANANVNIAASDGNTALHMAVGKLRFVNLLLAVPGINVNAVNSKGGSALHKAALGGQPAVLTAFLSDPRVDPNLTTNRYQQSALHLRVNHEVVHPDSISPFVGCANPNFNPNLVNGGGNTALHNVINNRQYDLLFTMLQIPNLDPTVVDSDGYRPFQYLSNDKKTKLIRSWAYKLNHGTPAQRTQNVANAGFLFKSLALILPDLENDIARGMMSSYQNDVMGLLRKHIDDMTDAQVADVRTALDRLANQTPTAGNVTLIIEATKLRDQFLAKENANAELARVNAQTHVNAHAQATPNVAGNLNTPLTEDSDLITFF